MRVKFVEVGRQRKFILDVLNELGCPSLRAFEQYGLDVSYSTLKNYFVEQRTLPMELFNKMCFLSGIKVDSFEIVFLDENWGQKKGGRRKCL